MSARREALGFRWYLSISFLLSVGFGILLAHLAITAAIEQAHVVVLRKLEDEAALLAAQLVLAEQQDAIRVFISASVIIGLSAAFGLIYVLGRRMILAPIAALRRSEALLRESEGRARRLAMVAEQTTDLVIIYDADGLIIWVNKAFEASTGYSRREVRGRRPGDFLNGPRSDLTISRRIREAMQRGEPIAAQIVNYSKSGREYLVELSVAPVLDEEGQIANFIAVERDITNRDRAQRRLQEAIEAIESAICVFDETESLVAFNEAYRKFSRRYGAKAVIGASLTDLVRQAAAGGMFADTGLSEEEAVARRLKEWRSKQSAEMVINYGDGASVLLREVCTHSGDTVSVRTDVTELTEARRKAEAATIAKSRFLAAISHEVRTPMNGVITMSELLLESDLSQDQRAGLELITQSGHALVTIINDILDFSKLEAGKMTLRPEPFDLIEGVEEVAALLVPTAAERGVVCAFDFDPEAPRFFIGDMGRIRQIVTNLFGNAIKFTEDGTVTLHIRAAADGDYARVEIDVIDTGVGISEVELEQVFSPFEQAENVGTARLQEGTGLGLSISRQLAAMMDGEVTATSTLGEGSVFTISLRLKIDPDAVLRQPLSGKRVRVLGAEARHAPRASQIISLGGQIIDDVAALTDHEPVDLVIAALDETATAPDGALEFGDTPLILVAPVFGSGEEYSKGAPHIRLLRRPVRQGLLARTIEDLLMRRNGATGGKAHSETGGTAKDARIVVVEDNQTNATIIRAILRDLVSDIDVYATATAGLAAIAETGADMIIMDLNLPDMSGLEAIRRIRDDEIWGTGGRTPIVAATASAADEDRLECLAAGADDFVLKPIDARTLRQIAVACIEGKVGSATNFDLVGS